MNLTDKIERFAFRESDTEDERFTKRLILIVSVSCCLCGVIWGWMYYTFLGPGLSMLLPLIFVLIVGVAIPVAHLMKQHLILIYAELICITWITAFIQWSIGSIHDSGIVIAWSFLGPIGALLFLDKRHAFFWMLQFISIVIISITIEPKLSNITYRVSDNFRTLSYLMNLTIPAIVVFGTSLYFVNDIIKKKNLNFSLLKITKRKNQEILDSIKYAKRLQNAIMPTNKQINSLIPNGFILYKPKDIVAGDFYWLTKRENDLYIAACDCTGHGVPGALVSVVCNGALNRSINEFALNSPGEILDKTRELVLKEFEKSEDKVHDGMDIALIKMNSNQLSFAGANNPLWIVRNDNQLLEEIKGCKQPVGLTLNPAQFKTHEVVLKSGDCIYIFTDGYTDQFGGPKNRKFMKKAFKSLLQEIHIKPIDEQKQILNYTIDNWKGNLEQVDDICVIGIKII